MAGTYLCSVTFCKLPVCLLLLALAYKAFDYICLTWIPTVVASEVTFVRGCLASLDPSLHHLLPLLWLVFYVNFTILMLSDEVVTVFAAVTSTATNSIKASYPVRQMLH